MEIKVITEEYYSQCMNIINLAKKMLKTKSGQWQHGYPNEKLIAFDIKEKRLFGAFEGNTLLALMALIKEKEPSYLKISNGSWLDYPCDNDLIVHRLAVLEGYHGKKIGQQMLNFAINYAKKNNLISVKIDTHENNFAMKKVIDDCGFFYCGVITILDEPVDNLRNAYEYPLNGRGNKLASVYDFLKKNRTYYLATSKESQPSIRPFGTIDLYGGSLYIQTGLVKEVAKEMIANPHIAICCFDSKTWLRIKATATLDNRVDVQNHMLKAYPELSTMYKPMDGNTATFKLSEVDARFCSFTDPEKHFNF
ncbi:MAG: GNAT family N-acetyltransferase [Bacilli bacterium]